MNYKAFCILGLIYYKNYKDAEKSAELFSKSLYFNSRYVPALLGMSTLLFENNHSDKALKYLEKALALEPLNA